MTWSVTVIVVATIAAGINAGAFFTFSNFVMPALADLPRSDGAAAMQSINRAAPSPLFVAAIVGAGLVTVPLVISESGTAASGQTRWLITGTAFSLLSLVITVAFNVPRNTALDALDSTAASTEPAWADYVATWTRWNTARTVTSVVSVAGYALSIRGR